MNKKAQAGLEYLVTYGWALVIVITFVGVLTFIISGPEEKTVFVSSDPTRILMQGGSDEGAGIELKMQNVTGGEITVTNVSLPVGHANCTMNETSIPETGIISVDVIAGGELLLDCGGVADVSREISIQYNDFADLQRNVEIATSTEEDAPGAPGYETPGLDVCSDCWQFGSCDPPPQFPCSAISDGITGNYWFGQGTGPPKWAYSDLGSKKFISGVRVYIYYADIPQTMNIQVSNDASSWTTVVSGWTVNAGETWVEKTFTETEGRYIRFYITSCKRSYCNFREYEIKTRT